MNQPVQSYNPGKNTVVVESFGYLHGTPPEAHITLDVRQVARDPHTSPHPPRELTGLEPEVRHNVMSHPEAMSTLGSLGMLVMTVFPAHARTGLLVQVAIGCASGRHRSVVLANELAHRLGRMGVRADVIHRDILKPVVNR